MRVLHNRRGITLLEAVITMFILSMAMLVFAAAMPTAAKSSRQAQDYKTATAIAQQKMEQLRSLKYELLTPAQLYLNGVIDPYESYATQHYFTTREQVASKLTQGSGYLRITAHTSDIKRVEVNVRWVSSSRAIPRSVSLTTYVADRRTRRTN